MALYFTASRIVPWVGHRPMREKAYWLDGAEFTSPDFTLKAECRDCGLINEPRQPSYPHQLHWIKPGMGTILAVRKFMDPRPNAIDDEEFEKITIWLKDLRPTHFDLANSKGIRSYYTFGGSAWFKAACGGVFRDGSIEITNIEKTRLIARLKGRVLCTSVRKPNDPSLKEIDETFEFVKTPTEAITSWIGSPASSPIRETYPRKED